MDAAGMRLYHHGDRQQLRNVSAESLSRLCERARNQRYANDKKQYQQTATEIMLVNPVLSFQPRVKTEKNE
jgi:hypothetical protein